ncbi:MAG: TIM barrel protein [Rubripirellula sp.]|nr:TIM barrel protein [Rubripirellula sp.]
MKRRDFLTSNVVLAGATLSANSQLTQRSVVAQDVAVKKAGGNVRQSVMGWCFKPMDAITLAKHCKRIGLEAIEGIPSNQYGAVTDLGLKISLVSSHGFAKGPLDPENHAEVEAKLRSGIDLAVEYGAPNVITFTGMQKTGISDVRARKNCLECWKRVIPYAEEKNVGIVLEHLNSKDDSHPMKGHPGYWGDDLHQCADLVSAVGSANFKLLFDVYHVQIMNGDLIRNIRRYSDIVGHYHTAGNPGRGELDDSQEINYPPVIRAIMETGYDGFIAQEFIPTRKDPVASLQEAFDVCDV